MRKILSILILITILALPLTVSAKDVKTVLIDIGDWLIALLVAIAIIMFIYAGILFLISAGSPETIGKAKKTLLYGVIGLIVALAAKVLAAAVEKIAK